MSGYERISIYLRSKLNDPWNKEHIGSLFFGSMSFERTSHLNARLSGYKNHFTISMKTSNFNENDFKRRSQTEEFHIFLKNNFYNEDCNLN